MNANPEYFQAPTDCPCCGFGLVREGAYLVCNNGVGCSAQRVGQIERWMEKVGIKEWGSTAIEALVEQGVVQDIADCYGLTVPVLSGLQLGGRVLGGSASVMVANLHAKKDLPLATLVGSLGIPLMGRSMVKVLVDASFDTLDKLQSATVPAIAAVPGMGQGRAQAFVAGIAAAEVLIARLLAAGVTIKAQAVGSMSGKSVCYTGVRCAEQEEAIEAAGGSIKGSVGKGLHFLVAKSKDTSSGKGQKAAALGVEVVTLDEMWKLLGR